MKPDINTYLTSWTDELNARANRVRHLIGDAHWLSDGHHKEAIIRDFLQRYLPPHLSTSRGFIRPPNLEQPCSPEIDILVSNTSTHPPFFSEGDLRIVSPGSVLGMLEVKSSFNSATLNDSLLSIYRSKLATKSWDTFSKLWSCICFFSIAESRTVESFSLTLSESIKILYQHWLLEEESENFDCFLPNCITTLANYSVYFKINDNEVKLHIFDLQKHALPCALIDLFSSIRCQIGGSVNGDFEYILDEIIDIEPIIINLKLGD